MKEVNYMEQIISPIKYGDYRRIPLFLNAVAEWYINNISEDDKKYMQQHPDIGEYWDTIGLHIRNEFIYPQKYILEQETEKLKSENKDWSRNIIDQSFVDDLFYNADEYSGQILEMIIKNINIKNKNLIKKQLHLLQR